MGKNVVEKHFGRHLGRECHHVVVPVVFPRQLGATKLDSGEIFPVYDRSKTGRGLGLLEESLCRLATFCRPLIGQDVGSLEIALPGAIEHSGVTTVPEFRRGEHPTQRVAGFLDSSLGKENHCLPVVGLGKARTNRQSVVEMHKGLLELILFAEHSAEAVVCGGV